MAALTKPGFIHFSAQNLLYTIREGYQDKPTGFITLSWLITSRASQELFQHPRLCPKHILEPNKVKKTTERFPLHLFRDKGPQCSACYSSKPRCICCQVVQILSNEFISNTVKITRITDDDENGLLHPVTDVHGSNIHNRERSTPLSLFSKGRASHLWLCIHVHIKTYRCAVTLVLGEEVDNSRLLRLF